MVCPWSSTSDVGRISDGIKTRKTTLRNIIYNHITSIYVSPDVYTVVSPPQFHAIDLKPQIRLYVEWMSEASCCCGVDPKQQMCSSSMGSSTWELFVSGGLPLPCMPGCGSVLNVMHTSRCAAPCAYSHTPIALHAGMLASCG